MLSAASLVYAASGVALAAIGLVVWALRPRLRAAQLLGAFCVGWGAVHAAFGLSGDLSYGASTPSAAIQAMVLAGWALAIAGTVGLAIAVPAPLAPGSRASTLLAGGAAAAMGAVVLVFGRAAYPDFPWALIVGNAAGNAALAFAFVALPLRFAATAPEERATRRTLALLAAALALLAAPEGGDLVLAARTGGSLLLIDPIYTAILLAAAPLWLRAAARGLDAKLARNVALLLPGAILLAMFAPSGSREWYYAPGVVASAALLAYAVLRGQIPGLDVKVRFAISRSTIAAIFVAVFFLASEGAQLVFGREDPVVGLVAAGALVFAMAPLQRAADRLAERAVPSAPSSVPVPVPGPASGGKEHAYRSALRAALRDKVLTREEEVGLAHLSDELGLTHKRAREIWHEVDAEQQGGAR